MFHKGYIEEIPLPDASVDVVISNCVINLSGDWRLAATPTHLRAPHELTQRRGDPLAHEL